LRQVVAEGVVVQRLLVDQTRSNNLFSQELVTGENHLYV